MTTEEIILKHYKEDDCRTWFYFPVPMPVNSCGHGPASIEEATSMTYEVWDMWYNAYASFEYLPDAINMAMKLNNRLLKGETVEQILQNH